MRSSSLPCSIMQKLRSTSQYGRHLHTRWPPPHTVSLRQLWSLNPLRQNSNWRGNTPRHSPTPSMGGSRSQWTMTMSITSSPPLPPQLALHQLRRRKISINQNDPSQLRQLNSTSGQVKQTRDSKARSPRKSSNKIIPLQIDLKTLGVFVMELMMTW